MNDLEKTLSQKMKTSPQLRRMKIVEEIKPGVFKLTGGISYNYVIVDMNNSTVRVQYRNAYEDEAETVSEILQSQLF